MVGTPLRIPALQLIGKALTANAAALDQAAEVTQMDVILARAIWLHRAPLRFASLLDAVTEEG